MKTEEIDNDEPIHHFEGEVQLDACPSESCGNLSGQHKEPKGKN